MIHKKVQAFLGTQEVFLGENPRVVGNEVVMVRIQKLYNILGVESIPLRTDIQIEHCTDLFDKFMNERPQLGHKRPKLEHHAALTRNGKPQRILILIIST